MFLLARIRNFGGCQTLHLPHTGPTLAGAILPVMVSTWVVGGSNIAKHGPERSGVVILIFLELMDDI